MVEGMRVRERKGGRDRGLHAGMWVERGKRGKRLWSGLGPVRNESLIS